MSGLKISADRALARPATIRAALYAILTPHGDLDSMAPVDSKPHAAWLARIDAIEAAYQRAKQIETAP